MALYKTEAIILKRINLGEADKILTAFSKEYGKIKFVAKGVRRIKSKLAGAVEPFYQSQLLIATGKNLDVLSSASLKKNLLSTSPDLAEIKTAHLFAEIIDKMAGEHQPNEELYHILVTGLELAGEHPVFARLAFESNFLRLSGIFPETEICVKCGDAQPGKRYFSLFLHGVICDPCHQSVGDAKFVNPEVISFWQKVAFDAQAADAASEFLPETAKFSERYLKNVTKREFKTDLI